MIFGILLSLVASVLPLIAGHVYARAVAATTPPPFVLRALPPEQPPVPAVATEPDQWDEFMGEIDQAVKGGRLRL